MTARRRSITWHTPFILAGTAIVLPLSALAIGPARYAGKGPHPYARGQRQTYHVTTREAGKRPMQTATNTQRVLGIKSGPRHDKVDLKVEIKGNSAGGQQPFSHSATHTLRVDKQGIHTTGHDGNISVPATLKKGMQWIESITHGNGDGTKLRKVERHRVEQPRLVKVPANRNRPMKAFPVTTRHQEVVIDADGKAGPAAHVAIVDRTLYVPGFGMVSNTRTDRRVPGKTFTTETVLKAMERRLR